MSLNEFLTLFVQVTFLLLALLTALEWLRRRSRARLDIAVMFSSLAAFILVNQLEGSIGQSMPWLRTMGNLALIAQPFLLLRIVHTLRPVPPLVRRAGLAGLLASAIILFVDPLSSLVPLTLLVITYFVCLEAYAAVALVRGALTTRGVTRWRLTLAAAGSGLLATTILLIGANALLPILSGLAGPLLQLMVVLAALSYFFGFTPPRWLRRAWQLFELHRYLRAVISGQVAEEESEVLDPLCRAANLATGGLVTVATFWDRTEQCLKLHASHGRALDNVSPFTLGDGAIRRAWQTRRPAVSYTVDDFGSLQAERLRNDVDAGTLLAVPIPTARHARGLLLVFMQGSPLFVSDDLALLALFSDQSAMALDYIALLTEQRSLVEQLAATNKELEAFAYSVSHDLRAPLRAIDGFSQALLEDCADQLDDLGHTYFERIRANAQQMGELIDAMLDLSRITRAEMHHEPVDLSAIAEDIAAELQQRDTQRQGEFDIEDGMLVEGDARLLQDLLENLLENAWKFTARQPVAHIEFSAMAKDGDLIYRVRDNGVGFDMAYADKLFGAFQRLHSMDDFSGTGIGLATVQRIVSRHGGRVWANAAPDEGATFYFTLANNGEIDD